MPMCECCDTPIACGNVLCEDCRETESMECPDCDGVKESASRPFCDECAREKLQRRMLW